MACPGVKRLAGRDRPSHVFTQENELEVLDSYEVVASAYDAENKKLSIQFNKAWLTQALLVKV